MYLDGFQEHLKKKEGCFHASVASLCQQAAWPLSLRGAVTLLRQRPEGRPPTLASFPLSVREATVGGPLALPRLRAARFCFLWMETGWHESSGHSPIITRPSAAGQATRGGLLEGPGGSGGQNPGQNERWVLVQKSLGSRVLST